MTQAHEPATQLTPLKRALLALEEMQTRLDAAQAAGAQPVAVIGLGCRFPGGANTPDAFWELLRSGGQATGAPPAARAPVVAGVEGPHCAGWLHEPVDCFDPQFFGIAPREAHGMDPQQRLLLEVAWEALESACQAPDRLQGSRTGVYIGISANDYLHAYLKQADQALFDGYYASGIAHSIASGRLSYLLGLQGPSLSVDTACSSSLSAVHLAVQSLRSGETDMALAGGVHIMLAPENFLAFERFGMLAADGRCKTFDAAADGFGRGEGCGIVVLKRLSDALAQGDRVLAVIRGSAMNQDGASSGLTAPNGPAQEAVIRAALAQASIDPAEVGFVETHGTGTALGDPIEVQALGSVFGAGRTPDRPLVLGAVKANLGHTEAAAGVAGLIKLILVLQGGEIPPQANYRTPSPFIPWAKLPFVVPLEVVPWPAGERRIGGVSAFGFSGTNVHVVVEAAPVGPHVGLRPAQLEGDAGRPLHLLALSARHPHALAELAARYADHLETFVPGSSEKYVDPAAPVPDSLADVCYSANAGRAHFARRLTLVASSTGELVQKLGAFAAGEDAPGVADADAERSAPPKIAFLFTGQGAQYAGMGRQLYGTQPTFRAALDRCAAILRPHLDAPLLDVLDPPPGAPDYLDDTTYTQPALFAVEYALAQLWQSWGVTPNFVLGHSVGEYVAAALAGVFSLEDGLALVAARGRLMGSLPAGGAMAAVFADEETVAAAVAPYAATVAVAAVNGPDNTVISGRRADVETVLRGLQAQGIKARPLKVSHAFHSPLVEPALAPLEQAAAAVTYRPPRLRLVSDVTGDLAPGGLVANAAYWRDHTRAPVRFAAGIETLRRQGVEIFLEIGPGATLIGMGERCLAGIEGGDESASGAAESPLWLASLKPPRSEWAALLDSLAALYRAGVSVDWEGFDRDYSRRRLALPSYPFQRQRYWLPVYSTAHTPRPPSMKEEKPIHPLLGRRLHSPLASVQYETHLSCGSLTYLDDHRLQGLAVLPGAAVMEAALAVGQLLAPGAGLAVHDLLLQEVLAVPDDSRRAVQWVAAPEEGGEWRLQCYSRSLEAEGAAPGLSGQGDSWRLHASARLALASPPALPPCDIAALQAALPAVLDAEAHYAGLAANGLDFGPSLHGVARIWRREGEALGRVAPPESVLADTEDYHLHPALLDAHLQVIAAAMPPGAGAYLPFSLEQLQLLRRGVQPAWSHVLLAEDAAGGVIAGATVRADIQLLDEHGSVVALLAGLDLKRLEGRLPDAFAAPGKRDAVYTDWLYEVAWESRPLSPLTPLIDLPEDAPVEDNSPPALPSQAPAWPPLPALAGDLARQLEELEDQHNLAAYALDVAPQLDRLSLAYILQALAELGWQPQQGERFTTSGLAQELGIIPRHVRLMGRLCAILAEDGLLSAEESGWQVRTSLPSIDPAVSEGLLRQGNAAYAAEIELVARCGRQLAAALAGRIDPVHLLFPQGDLSTTEALYRESPSARVYNGLLRAAVQTLIAAHRGPLRILEIGGGTGGTTAYLLPVLPAEQATYLFTDISPLFVARAEEKFGRWPFAEFAVLDLEKDPAAQGLAGRQFDLVVAANVVHATADLRRSLRSIHGLLAPGGVLVLLEVTGAQRWVDVTFGLTDGWWRFTDAELRPAYPLLAIRQWRELLAGCGFDTVAATPSEDGAGFIDQALILARRTFGEPTDAATGPGHVSRVNLVQEDTPAPLGHWLLLADRSGAGERLAQQLARRGAQVILAFAAGPAAPEQPLPPGSWLLDPMQPEGFRRLLDAIPGGSLAGAVHLWSLDAPPGEIDAETLAGAVASSNASALHLVQALAAHAGDSAPRLWFVTRGAQAVAPEGQAELAPGVAQSPLWGLAQAVTLEHPEWQPAVVDLDPSGAEDGEGLLSELLAPDGEDRTAWRGGRRYAARLAASRLAPSIVDELREPGSPPGAVMENAVQSARPPSEGERLLQLEIAERGTLQGLALRPLVRRSPAPGEVEIRVQAAGLNFKDVLNTLGMYPGDAGPLGGECAGEVVAVGEGVTELRVGQAVLAIAPGAMRSYATAQAALTAPLPPGMSYAEGASIPIAFVTAAYTLQHLAQLRRGERVLIHAAAGGVGLAAVQIAQRAGAEVIATAGSAGKRDYLRSLGVAHVFDSRSLAFVEGVRAATGGGGVDVVLNSLAGEFVGASLSLLAAGGRFVEIGKRGLLTPQEAAALGADRRYFAVDWTPDALANPALIRGLLDEVLEGIAAGELKLLPHRLFVLEEAEAAFRCMAQAQHTGKIVLLAGSTPPNLGQRRLRRIRPDRSYLVTGGLRGLGLLTAGWLAVQGAGALALVGRSEPGAEERAAIARIEAGGCRVLVIQADVAAPGEVARVLAAIAESLPPLAGVVHCAGVLDDGVLMQQSWPRFAGVLAPKVQGAWMLHQLTRALPLDFFVLYSSLASLFGSAGQGNHAAANAFLDALACHRRGQGLPATSINWGVWSQVGIAARLAASRQEEDRAPGFQGLGAIAPQEGMELFGAILSQEIEHSGRAPAQIGVTPVAWPRYAASFAGAGRPFFARFAGGAAAAAHAPAAAPAVGKAAAPARTNGAALSQELAALPAAKRRARLIDFIKVQAGQVLGLDPQACSERAPLSDLGLDSLMAVELRNVLSQRLGLKRPLPATLVFDYPSIQAMADYLLAGVLALDTVVQPVGAVHTAGQQPAGQLASGLSSLSSAQSSTEADEPGDALLADLESLSDEEVERRLAHL